MTSYEVFASEGLHELKEHVKNLITELPHHLAATTKSLLNHLVETELGTLSLARGSDYRQAAMNIPILLCGKSSTEVQQLVDTLSRAIHTLVYN